MVGATVSEVKAKVLKSDQEAREKRRKKERREKEATVKENGEGQAAGVLEGNRGGMSAMGSMSSPCAIDGVGEMGGMGSTGGVGGIGSGGGGGGGESPRPEPVTETFDSLDTDYEDRLQDRSSILGFRGDPASIDGTCNALRCCGCARRCDVLCVYVGRWQWTWQVPLSPLASNCSCINASLPVPAFAPFTHHGTAHLVCVFNPTINTDEASRRKRYATFRAASKELSQKLTWRAFDISLEKNGDTPYSRSATDEFDVIYRGGKKDDITVIVALVEVV